MTDFRQAVTTTIDGKLSYITPVGISELGTPIIDNVKFLGGKFKDYKGNEYSYDSLAINDATLTVTRAKRIVTSTVNGVPGDTKEYITTGDFNISLSGSINSIVGFPVNRWVAMSKLEAVPEAVKVVSKFLNSIFGVDYVVIANFQAIQAGSINDFNISMDLLSDKQKDFSIFVE